MRRIAIALAAATAGLILTTGLAFAAPAIAQATLVPVIPTSHITAHVNIVDSGDMDVVSGTGTGFEAGQFYFSLFYNAGSPATGPGACEPTNNSLSFAQMVVGVWLPMDSTSRTLSAIKTHDGIVTADLGPLAQFAQGDTYAPLSNVGTMSVRKGMGVLQSCGNVNVILSV